MAKNNFKTLALAAISAITFAACDPGDLGIKRMYHGDGTWTIESLRWQTFDSTGTKTVIDTTQENLGELIFFRSKTTNALFDHYCVVAQMKQADGSFVDNPGEVFFDGVRANMQEDPDGNHNYPDDLEGLWTVTENHRKSQVWTIYANQPNGYLGMKKTLTLKKK